LILAPLNNLVANPQSFTTPEDTQKSFTLTGSGGSPLLFNIVAAPKHGKITTGTAATRTYTPQLNYSGKDSFTFSVSLGCLASLPAKVLITLTPVNDTPVLAAIGNRTIVKNTLLTFTATATDVDAGQTRTFSLIMPPAGAAINSTTGVFTWTPTVAGSFVFKIRVTDNGSPILFDEEQITVTVTNAFAGQSTSSMTVAEDSYVKIYPNPAKDKIIVSLSGRVQDQINVTVKDMSGTTLRRSKYNAGTNNIEVNVETVTPGTYMLQIQTGQRLQTIKFIKM
jgi:hypothetical protein